MITNILIILNVAYCAFYKSAVSDFFYLSKKLIRGPPFNQFLNEFDWRKIVCQQDQKEESIEIILIR